MDLYPVRVTIENVGPFRGKFVIDLADSVYSVLAMHEHNPEQSNWLGKSTFLWCAGPYPLFGEHPYKTDNEWVNNGSQMARVTYELSDKSRVVRTKERDKNTRLEFFPQGSRKPITQKAAQAAIENLLGLSRDDFMATCFYEQKQLARLVSARSAERIEMVESWLAEDLDPIQAMHADAVVDLAKANADIAKANAMKVNAEEALAELADAYQLTVDDPLEDEFSGFMEAHQRALEQAEKRLSDAKAARLSAESWATKVEAAEEFDEVVASGEQLKRERQKLPDDLEQQEAAKRNELIHLTGEHQLAQQEYDRAVQSRAGKFDGACPINGQACPSMKWVVENTVSDGEQKKRLKVFQDAQAALSTGVNESTELARKLNRRAELDGKLETLREQASALVDVANEVAECEDPPDITKLDFELGQAETALTDAREALREGKEDTAELASIRATLKQVSAKLVVLNEERALRAEAVQLLGKTGAQQRLGELALAHVEQGANALLQAAGIALNVTVRWVTHLQGHAKHCDQCGTAFPASARVKQCLHCGAQRGPNVSAKLVIELSNRSGAAEDLAGIAVGLAASQWLRHKRASGWSSVFIDEPFGALDTHNKRALSVHVATLLSRSFSSAFVVAHDKSILDALPSRITIIGTDKGSKLSHGEAV